MSTVRLVPDAGGRVLRLVLDRPDRLNALTGREVAALRTLVDQAAGSGARALILQATGRAFCAGADLDYLRAVAGSPPSERPAHLRGFIDLVVALARCPLPTVAAVHGACFGAGSCLALACDQVVAGDDARLGLVFTAMGLGGGTVGATWLLARRVPTRVAWRLLADAATLDAAQALSLGLVDRVVAREDLERAALEQAEAWADVPGTALADTKRALLHVEGADTVLEEHARRALEDIVAAFGSPELRRRLEVGRP